jgi:hypothetical protein
MAAGPMNAGDHSGSLRRSFLFFSVIFFLIIFLGGTLEELEAAAPDAETREAVTVIDEITVSMLKEFTIFEEDKSHD